MKSVVAVVVDGVMRKAGGIPIPEGIALYHGLGTGFNVILLRSEDDGDNVFKHFLISEQLTLHSQVVPWISWAGSARSARLIQANRLRTEGYAVQFVVEPDPELAAHLYLHGFSVLHFMHAIYARPDWRPDWKAKRASWDELVAEMRHTVQVKESDKRTGHG